jgi:DNA-binding response OmpR family regulator
MGSEHSVTSKKNKILIAEDDLALQNALRTKFKVEGFEVDIANNGAEAIKYMQENNYNLILLDLIMPDVDGFEVLTYYSAQKLTTPVIVLSNLSQEEDIIKAKKFGAKDFLIKSNLQLSQIVAIVKESIE